MENAHAMISAGCEKHVAHAKVLAAIKNEQMRSIKIAFGGLLARTGVVTVTSKKLRPVAIDGSGTLNGHIFRIGGGEEHDIPVAGRSTVAGAVILRMSTAQKPTLSSEMERNVALEFERADQEISGGHEHG